MEKKEENKMNPETTNDLKDKPDTFNDHWGTGKFLGPNTLRHEESIKIYEEGE